MRSNGSRYRTELYSREGSERFCIVEKVAKGVLLSEFNTDGEILVQLLNDTTDPEAEMRKHLGVKDVEVTDTDSYSPVRLNAECVSCKGSAVVRELDLSEPQKIKDVPVVPLYVCSGCKKHFYTMTDEYLRFLVSANSALFEEEEAKERVKDEALFIKTLQEYIVRIFAARKISRITIKR